ncbi:MAG: hypothetical protein EOP00_08690 [Pedobacter sp.]|nr:MAG: hypothetical protein EOP00_08690 [Pedobacter sp.]
MKPTEPNKPLNTELIAHVRERLLAHEESYVQGAWEKFNTPEKKKRPVLWLQFLSGAAAMLIIGFGTFLMVDQTEKIPPVVVVKMKKDIPNTTGRLKNEHNQLTFGKPNSEPQVKVAKQNSITLQETAKYNPIEIDLKYNDQNTIAVSPKQAIGNVVGVTAQKPVVADQEKPIAKETQVMSNNAPKQNPSDIIAFLESETKKNQMDKKDNLTTKKDSKFTLGLVVAPSFGNVKKLNMGYGVSLDYALSDKFSVNSGIAYNQMAATKNAPVTDYAMNSPSTSAIIAQSSTKSLQSVEEKIAGIDIPLELKYNFNKNIYANVGVSAFAVISQQRNNTFIENRVEQRVQSLTDGKQQLRSVLVTDRVIEEVAPTKAEDYSYLGFYNFSFGYKKKINKNNAFAIEPFLKLPMKPVSTENLRLIGTGVKLKFDF